MIYLALDSATDTAGLALAQDDLVIAELNWRTRQNHSVELMPNLERLLGQASLKVAEINAVIVGRGPGSYSGLRVGVGSAKGLAFALGIPLVGVSTLAQAAYPLRYRGLPVCVIYPAGRDEFATASYRSEGNDLLESQPERLRTIPALCEEITEATVFTGDFSPEATDILATTLGERAQIAAPEDRLRRAANLLALGVIKLNAGEQEDPRALQPVYLRRPPITEPKHR
jgi:tRNA threonylcarbamoyladenosine biosynthesis protein TsaB